MAANTMDREMNQNRANTPKSDEFRESLSDAGSNIRQAASNAVPAAQEQMRRAGENAASAAQSVEEYLTDRIHEKPLGSLIVAGLVGMFVGAFVLRR